MKKLNQFWSGLEALPGLAAVLAEWQRVWRQDYEIGRAFLHPTGRLATSYPCPHPGGSGCPRGVVIHGERDIVAVCRSVPKRCDTIVLTKQDITVHELGWRRLGTAIGRALGLTMPRRPAEVLPLTARLGWHYLVGGRRVAVYLTIQHEPQAFAALVSRLLADVDLPFILAAPTPRLCDSERAELLRRMRVLFLPLDECLAWEDTQQFVPTERLGALLSDLAAHHAVRSARIEVPRSTRWDELQIVMDDLSLRYEVREKRGELSFKDAGFEDGRMHGSPNRAWALLQAFALGGGRLREGLVPPELTTNLKHPVSALRRRLLALFDIAGEPIEKPKGEAYRTVFRIRSKDGITISVPADCTWSGISIVETRTGNVRFTVETKERHPAFSDGPATQFTREVAERPGARTEEHDLWMLGLLEDDGQLNTTGRALLDVLRARGHVTRSQKDTGLLRLGDLLCRMTGIEESAFEFRPRRNEWISNFEAMSEHASR